MGQQEDIEDEQAAIRRRQGISAAVTAKADNVWCRVYAAEVARQMAGAVPVRLDQAAAVLDEICTSAQVLADGVALRIRRDA